jgi:hypothetical protein
MVAVLGPVEALPCYIPTKWIPQALSKATIGWSHLFNHCLWLSHFQKSLKEAKVLTLPKPSKDPKFPQNLHSISLLSTTGKLFEKFILHIVQKHTEERNLLNTSQFRFTAHHSMTLQRMRLTDHVTLTFNNNMSMAVVFLDIEKAFDTTWHSGLLYKLSKLEFSTRLSKLIGSFLTQHKFRVSVEGKMSMPRKMPARMPQGSVLPSTLHNMYIKIMTPPSKWCLPSRLCQWHLSVHDRSKGGFCCQKTTAWSQLNGDLVWALGY